MPFQKNRTFSVQVERFSSGVWTPEEKESCNLFGRIPIEFMSVRCNDALTRKRYSFEVIMVCNTSMQRFSTGLQRKVLYCRIVKLHSLYFAIKLQFWNSSSTVLNIITACNASFKWYFSVLWSNFLLINFSLESRRIGFEKILMWLMSDQSPIS